MALLKTISWKYNLSINYWMIGRIHINKLKGTTLVEVFGYLSKEQRNNNINEFCETLYREVDGIDNTISELYLKLKEDIIDDEGNVQDSFF